MKFEFRCPSCGAPPNACGRKSTDVCEGRHPEELCMGFICECTSAEADTDGHGELLNNQCPEASCYHCGWGGVFPKAPKGMQAWERKALAAGWTMPPARKKELEHR